MANACSELEKKWWKARQEALVARRRAALPVRNLTVEELEETGPIPESEVLRAIIASPDYLKKQKKADELQDELAECYEKHNLLTSDF